MIAEITLWVSLGTVAFAYLGYPPVIWLLSRLFGRPSIPPQVDGEWPTVTLVIAAFNEESEIAGRLASAAALNYPIGRLEIVVASDGSTDRTHDIVRECTDPRVQLIAFPERRGKPAVLNAVVPTLTSDLIAFSDANSLTSSCSIRSLARWFGDPTVGAVCGRLVLTDPATGRNVDSLYWKYETFLKKCESRLGALLGANGAIYAVRRSLMPPLPDDTIIDDFVLPLRAKLQSGCRIVYDRDAVAMEETPGSLNAEFQRRARIGAGGFQAIGLLAGLLHPRQGWVAFTFFAHKVLRWVGPFLLLIAIAANLVLIDRPTYQLVFLVQLVGYALALVGALMPTGWRPLRFIRLATMFATMNAALLVGFVRWLTGRQGGAWQRTARAAESA